MQSCPACCQRPRAVAGHGQSALRRPFRARLCRLPAFPSSITDGTEMEKCVLALASAAFADPSRFATFVESIVSLVLAITILHPPTWQHRSCNFLVHFHKQRGGGRTNRFLKSVCAGCSRYSSNPKSRDPKLPSNNQRKALKNRERQHAICAP